MLEIRELKVGFRTGENSMGGQGSFFSAPQEVLGIVGESGSGKYDRPGADGLLPPEAVAAGKMIFLQQTYFTKREQWQNTRPGNRF